MRKIILISAVAIVASLLAFIASPPKSVAAEWTKADIGLEITYGLAHIIDWRQTRYIAKNPHLYHETNFALGEHPSTKKVDIYFGLTGIGHIAVTHLLSSKYRPIWQSVWIGIETSHIANNYSIGIKVDW